MPTLGDLKAHLADDIADTSGEYATQIARSIERAIEHYRKDRFAFNETRDVSFSTVAAQQIYTETDDADIPLIVRIDGVFYIDGDGQASQLSPLDPVSMELASDVSASSGEPTGYTHFANSLRIYPIPDAAYTIRVMCHIRLASPANDGASNAWTTTAYDLIHAAALEHLAKFTLRDTDLAMVAADAKATAEDALTAEQNKKYGTGYISPTCW